MFNKKNKNYKKKLKNNLFKINMLYKMIIIKNKTSKIINLETKMQIVQICLDFIILFIESLKDF